jgi:pilus assembly protein CpaB
VSPRNIILVLAALLTAGGTVYFVRGWLSSERAAIEAMRQKPVEEKPETFILVAKKGLPAGIFIKPDHLRWQAWPEKNLASEYFVKGKINLNLFTGAVVRRGIAAGEPISDGRLVKSGERGFLAAVLTPGMRAISVPVNATTGIAGMVFPGDRVDMLLTTQTKRTVGKETRVLRASETVLTGIRILAVDQKTADQGNTPKLAKTATIEVTPKQAEIIAVAAEIGRLSLTLRSLARHERIGAGGSNGAKKNMVLTSTRSLMEDDARPPKRGRSVTLDSEASRMVRRISGKSDSEVQVHVLRGEASQQLSFSARGVARAARNFLGSSAKGMNTLAGGLRR